jgi:HEPN domain-containing protein
MMDNLDDIFEDTIGEIENDKKSSIKRTPLGNSASDRMVSESISRKEYNQSTQGMPMDHRFGEGTRGARDNSRENDRHIRPKSTPSIDMNDTDELKHEIIGLPSNKISGCSLDQCFELPVNTPSVRYESAENGCTYIEHGSGKILQSVVNCLDCFRHKSGVICVHCANTCHKGHRLSEPKKISAVCECGFKQLCGMLSLQSRTFDIKRPNLFGNGDITDDPNLNDSGGFNRKKSEQQMRTDFDLFDSNKSRMEIDREIFSNRQKFINKNVKPCINQTVKPSAEQTQTKLPKKQSNDLVNHDIKQITPSKIAKLDINSFNSELFEEFIMRINKSSFLISPFNFYMLMCMLYHKSTGCTEKIIKKLLRDVDKKDVYETIIELYRSIANNLKLSSIMIYDKDTKIKPHFIQSMYPILKIYKEEQDKCKEMNRYMSKDLDHMEEIYNTPVPTDDSVISNYLRMDLFLNYETYYMMISKKYLCLKMKCKIFDNDGRTLYEFDCHNKNYKFGIVKSKSKDIHSLSNLEIMIMQMKDTVLGSVYFPTLKNSMIKQSSKFDMSGVLKDIGLEFINELEMNGNIEPSVKLSSFIHSTSLNVKFKKVLPDVNFYDDATIDLSNEFIYYVRYVGNSQNERGIILLTGFFYV